MTNQASQQTRPHHELMLAYIQNTRAYLTSLTSVLKKLAQTVFDLKIFFTLLILLFLSLEIVRDRGVIFGTILVPQELTEMGYTPVVVAERLKDNSTIFSTEEYTTDVKMNLGHENSDIDFVLPTTSVSVRSLVRYFRDLIGWVPTTITGELLYHKSEELVSLRLRIDSELVLDVSTTFGEDGMDELFEKGGQEIIKRIDPIALGVYHYTNEEYDLVHDIVRFVLDESEFYGTETYALAVNLKGLLHEINAEFDEAIRSYERLLSLDKSHAVTAYTNWGATLTKLENPDWDGAIKKFSKAIDFDPTDGGLYFNLGIALMRKNDPEIGRAITQFETALRMDSGNANLHYAIGAALANLEEIDWDKVILHLREAIWLGQKDPRVHYHLALALEKRVDPDWDEVARHYREAVEIGLDDANLDVIAARNLAIALVKAEIPEWDEVITHLTKALAFEPEDAKANLYLAQALVSTARPDFDKAIEHYRKAISLGLENAALHRNLAITFLSKNDPDWDEAIKHFNKVLALEPEDEEIHFYLSVALTSKEYPNWDKAIYHCKEAIRLGLRRDTVYFHLAEAFVNKVDPNWDEAIEPYREAIRLGLDQSQVYNRLGVALINATNPDLDEAIKQFNEALARDPNNIDALNNLQIAGEQKEYSTSP